MRKINQCGKKDTNYCKEKDSNQNERLIRIFFF